ncbi:MAG: 6-carboxyhexanoate--CoA ligase [Aquificaceae bacterium]|nr:6-carboxyhexanoate--CoA ligase [Aquificaceae bacterium]
MYSLRMRAEKGGEHVSGAERLVKGEDIKKVLTALAKRPKDYDKMVITVEKVQSVEVIPKALSVFSYDFENVSLSHSFAVEKLKQAGIEESVALKAVELLKKGPNPKGGNMRGAVLMDMESGERLEPDKERGIRTVRVDWKNRESVRRLLRERGIRKQYLERFLDALVLATKNVHCGVIAELCWSDDPDYTTGYVAGRDIGYVRIKPMKEYGVPIGGRVYFIQKERRDEIIECLEKKAMIVEVL